MGRSIKPSIQSIQTVTTVEPSVQRIQTRASVESTIQSTQTRASVEPSTQSIQTRASKESTIQSIQTRAAIKASIQTITTIKSSIQSRIAVEAKRAGKNSTGAVMIETSSMKTSAEKRWGEGFWSEGMVSNNASLGNDGGFVGDDWGFVSADSGMEEGSGVWDCGGDGSAVAVSSTDDSSRIGVNCAGWTGDGCFWALDDCACVGDYTSWAYGKYGRESDLREEILETWVEMRLFLLTRYFILVLNGVLAIQWNDAWFVVDFAYILIVNFM